MKIVTILLGFSLAASAVFAQTRQQALDEIARLEKMPAQIAEMLRQAWEAGRTQRDTVIDTPYGTLPIKFNLDEVIKETLTGSELSVKLRDWHGVLHEQRELRINNGGSWKNETYEGMKATITHELGHYMEYKKAIASGKSSKPVLKSGYRSAVDASEMEADAFAMRYIGKAQYIEILKSGIDSQDYIDTVINRMEEMELDEKENLVRLRAIAGGASPADAAQQAAAQMEAARRQVTARQEEAARKYEAERPMREANTLYWSGKAAYDKNDYDKAITDFTEAIRLNPNFTNAYNSRADIYYKKGDYDKAIADYTETIRLDPNRVFIYHYRASAYAKKGDYDKVIADYTEAIRLEPYIWRYIYRAEAYESKGDYDKAITDYIEAVRLVPNSDLAYSRLIRVIDKRGDYNKAIADYTKLIQLQPSVRAYSERGFVYMQKRKYKEARADANEALKLDPNFPRAIGLDAELKKKRH